MLGFLEHHYSTLRLLSIDVSLAALSAGLMATHLLNVHPHPIFYVVLPLAVWVVYTLDHLLDARHIGSAVTTPRHRFHRRFAAPLWLLALAATTICAILGLTQLSTIGIHFGLVMAALFLIHETLVKLSGNRASPLLLKEIGVAVIFTAGTWGLPLMLRYERSPIPLWSLLILLQYLLLALANLLVFAIFEIRIDQRQRQTSFARGVGPQTAKRLARLALLAQPLLGAIVLILHRDRATLLAQFIYLIMSVTLAIILFNPKTFARRERYRALGDGAFLLPLLMLLSP